MDSWVGLTMIYDVIAQLLSHFYQLPISPSRTRQRVEQPKSKSTQPNCPNRWTTLYIFLLKLSVRVMRFICPRSLARSARGMAAHALTEDYEKSP